MKKSQAHNKDANNYPKSKQQIGLAYPLG